MNFIKKKLKSHKKDDEEEEYEKAVYEQSLHPQTGDSTMKNTEEWQFFQQLSMKVQDTVQKTQTTLNKLKDIRQDSLSNSEDPYDIDDDLSCKEILTDDKAPSYGNRKVLRAPPRPPPPSAEKSNFASDAEFSSDFSQSSKGPPRPPPPESADPSFHLDSSALQGSIPKSFGSPARPPPPTTRKQDYAHVAELVDSTISNSTEVASLSLLDEFGFKDDSLTSSGLAANFQDLLFLDVKEEIDPFDTSFVNVTNIASQNSLLNTDADSGSKASESNFNPFSSPDHQIHPSDDWMQASVGFSNTGSKLTTNPFFSGSLNGSKSDEKEQKFHSWSAYNPFGSDNNISPESNAKNEFFGIDISPVKDVNNGSLPTNKQSLDLSLKQTGDGLLKSDLILDEPVQLDDCNTTMHATQDSSNNLEISCVKSSWVTDEDSNFFDETGTKFESPTKSGELSETAALWNSYAKKSDISSPTKVINESKKSEHNVTGFNVGTAEPAVSNPSGEVNYGSLLSIEGNLDEPCIETKFETETTESVKNDSCSTECKTNVLDFSVQKSHHSEGTSDNFDLKATEIEISELCIKTEVTKVDDNSFASPFDEENKTTEFVFMMKATDETSHLEFDAFAAKFESAKECQMNDAFDPFLSRKAPTLKKIQNESKGFDSMDEFDPFKVTKDDELPNKFFKKEISRDSFEDYDNDVDFSVVIKPKVKNVNDVKPLTMEPPKLLPPPKTPTRAFEAITPRFNPFDKDYVASVDPVDKHLDFELEETPALGEAGVRKADSMDTPLSPLFDEDTSQPLEAFPPLYTKEGWEMVLRQPNKKKLTGNRFWKKIFVKLSDNSVLQLFNKVDDKLPFQELPLQACYSLSEIGAQQYDQYGKIFTVKLQYKFYRERVGVRPGQISKVTQGQVTSMGDVAKLGLPLQHSPQTSQLLKLGSQYYKDIQLFIQEVEDVLFRMVVHRDRVLTYKTEEIQVIAQDEFYVEQSKTGHVDKQLARVRIFFLAFITGMPSVEVGLNDINRQGKEVVGRYDIIPVVTEEWIRLEDCEFHSCVIQDEFQKNRLIKFHPPDACLFELLRFRIRPPKNRELPLQVRVFMTVSSTRVEIRSDILVPGYSSRKQGQVPCENIQIRFPVPECWIYLFRTEKHFRYGSKKSTARRPGKIKGLERIIGAAQNLDPSLIEVSAGQAKYEHVFHAVVWRIPRLPKEGQGAYTQQLFLLRTELTSFDQIPESFERFVDVEFTMPATYVSHTTVRSVSVTNPIPPEKYVRYISKHEYKVEIEFKSSSDDIVGLMAPNVSMPVSTSAVQESTEDEEKDDSD